MQVLHSLMEESGGIVTERILTLKKSFLIFTGNSVSYFKWCKSVITLLLCTLLGSEVPFSVILMSQGNVAEVFIFF